MGTQSDEAPKLAQDRRTVLTQTRGEGSRRQERRSGQPPPGPLPGPLVPWDRDNAQVSGKSHDPSTHRGGERQAERRSRDDNHVTLCQLRPGGRPSRPVKGTCAFQCSAPVLHEVPQRPRCMKPDQRREHGPSPQGSARGRLQRRARESPFPTDGAHRAQAAPRDGREAGCGASGACWPPTGTAAAGARSPWLPGRPPSGWGNREQDGDRGGQNVPGHRAEVTAGVALHSGRGNRRPRMAARRRVVGRAVAHVNAGRRKRFRFQKKIKVW